MQKPGRDPVWPARNALFLVSTAFVASLAASAVAQDEIYDRVHGNSTDRAIVTVTRTTEGRETTHDEYGENLGEGDALFTWRREPTTLTATLVSRNYWSFDRVRWDLASWQMIYDQALANRQLMLQYSGPISTAYSDPSLLATYEAVERYSEDVELLLRVLSGIEFFEVIVENYPERIGPVSDPPNLTAGQASAYSKYVYASAGGDTVTESSADAESYQVSSPEWGFDDYEAAAARAGVDPAQFRWSRSNGPLMWMVLWRYDPADMARVAELIEQLDTIAAELHWDPPQMDDPNFQASVDSMADAHNATYERIFVSAVRDVVRYAWALGPQEPPPGFWSNVDPVNGYELQLPPDDGSPPDPFGVLFVAADAPLALPDLLGDRMALLRLPVDGLASDQPVGAIFKSSGTESLSFGPTFSGGYWLKDAERIVTVGIPERERHRFSGEIMGPHAFSNLSIAGSGVLEGSFTIVYRYIADPEMSGTTKTHYDHEYKVHVNYSIAIEGGDREDFTIPMTLSLAHRLEGEIVPLTGPLHYGDGFYVEALLEEPATREAYSVEVALNGVTEKVVLKPVEPGGLLLRSEMRYLIWDVPAERAGVALPARLSP